MTFHCFRRLFFFISCFIALKGIAADAPAVSRVITVSDGLPQSFVSGIFQDSNGFLWVSTLNGLGRYDGKQFKQYLHTINDTAGLSGNIILHLFDAGNNNLLVGYPDGKIDRLNTVTEKVTHLWSNKNFGTLPNETVYFRSLVHNDHGVCWMMAHDGGVFRIDLNRNSVTHLSPAQLNTDGPALGLAVYHDSLLLFTQTTLFIYDNNNTLAKAVPYPFTLRKYLTKGINIYSPAVRPNGDLIFTDADGLKIWNPFNRFFKAIALNRPGSPGRLIATFDHQGNYYFEFQLGVYRLEADNKLTAWLPAISAGVVPTSLYVDRSGVFWLGTNGFGLRQYNLLQTGMPGYKSNRSFVYDALALDAKVKAQMEGTFLSQTVPYASRTATFKDSVWISDINLKKTEPQLLLFAHGNIRAMTFRNEDQRAGNEKPSVQFMCVTKAGVLWGIDQHHQLLRFDTRKRSYRVYAKADFNEGEELNGVLADNEQAFYICTNKSLSRVDITTGKTEKLTDALPSKYLFCISNDTRQNNILWIGTMSDGLIRFNKNSKTSQLFSLATGLPNNTIYGILSDSAGVLWCSSNKGIYGFNPKNQTVRSFTSKDGLPVDEFNRYHYMQLPGGDMAFGGSAGYTVFNPARLNTDVFDPGIAVTGINVINREPVKEPLNTLDKIALHYDQNFLTVTFAAMQFDFPEKIQYRHLLKNLDKNWVTTGNENVASYTSLPPGNYTLLLNATNTSGKWSKYVRQIEVLIAPPFWLTWWFYVAVTLIVISIIYAIISIRVRSIKKAEAQKLQFEREAMELHTMALRARMNPHFIFNCLNSIKALIQEKDDRKAINYLTTFATLIRKQLHNNSTAIMLKDELETCRLYLELESLRFEGRISYHFSVEDGQLYETLVPPLTLQPVIENAIVHGLLPKEQGGRIDISVSRENQFAVCEIEDNGIGRAASEAHKRNGSRLHQSKGINLLEERISMHNHMNDQVSSLQIIDLFNEGKAAGTRVILKFNTEA